MGAEPSVREAAEMLIAALNRQERLRPDYSAEIVMHTVKPVLELGVKAFTRAEDRRRARAALAMVNAELGIDA